VCDGSMGVRGGLVGATTASSMVGGVARWRLQRSSFGRGGHCFAPPAAPVVEGAEGVCVFPSKVQCLFRIVDGKVRLVVACASAGWLFLSIRRKPCPVFHAGAGNGDTLQVSSFSLEALLWYSWATFGSPPGESPILCLDGQ
jgi:hypothetical protein